mmetsp:Transcript_15221/g.19599  ORF Transcript_15221/g.19599 Transcript_15221/m.19599 type:complete len:295 (-) Transcript_15221:468-1352(-)
MVTRGFHGRICTFHWSQYRFFVRSSQHSGPCMSRYRCIVFSDTGTSDGRKSGQEAKVKMVEKGRHLVITDPVTRSMGAKRLSLLLQNGAIHSVNLWKNRIGPSGAEFIATALTNLRMLNLRENGIGDKGVKALVDGILAQGEKSMLKILDLSSNDIGDAGADWVGKMLGNHKCALENLVLAYNKIGPNGARDIAKGLKKNITLQSLDLRNRTFGKGAIKDTGAKVLAEALKENGILREIFLDSNGIGADGARALNEALTSNISLTQISLKNNKVTPEVFQLISESLNRNKGFAV